MKSKILFWHIPKTGGAYTGGSLKRLALRSPSRFEFTRIGHEFCRYMNKDLIERDYPGFTWSDWDDCYKFTTARDPLQRVIGTYFWQEKWCPGSRGRKPKSESTHSWTTSVGRWEDWNETCAKYGIRDIKSFLDNYKALYYNDIHIQPDRLEEHNSIWIEYRWKSPEEPTKHWSKEQAADHHHTRAIQKSFWRQFTYPQWWFVCDDDKKILVDKVVKSKDIDRFLRAKFHLQFDQPVNRNAHDHSNDDYLLYTSKQNRKDIYEIYEDDYRIFDFDYN